MKKTVISISLFFVLFTSTVFSQTIIGNADSLLYEIKMMIIEDIKTDGIELEDSMNPYFGNSYELKLVVENDYCILSVFRRPPVLPYKSKLKWITYMKLIFCKKKSKVFLKYQFIVVQKKYDADISIYWGEYHFDKKNDGPMYIISRNIIKIKSIEEAKALAESEWK